MDEYLAPLKLLGSASAGGKVSVVTILPREAHEDLRHRRADVVFRRERCVLASTRLGVYGVLICAASSQGYDCLHHSPASPGLPSVLNPPEKLGTNYPRMISDSRRFEFAVGDRAPDRHIAAFAQRRRFFVGVEAIPRIFAMVSCWRRSRV